jgi:tetratricopeptide (TPR) repeat protein
MTDRLGKIRFIAGWGVLASLGFGGIAWAAGEATGTAKMKNSLREVVTLPMECVEHRMGLTLGLGYTVDEGFGFQSSAEPESIRACRSQVSRHPKDSKAWYRLGQMLVADDRPQQADEALSRAIDLARADAARHPNGFEAALRLGRALSVLGQRAEAVVALRSAVERWPKRCSARIALAAAIVGLGTAESRDEAKQVYDEALLAFPRRATVYAARAGLLFYGFQEQALEDYRRAGELAPDDPYALALSPWMEEAASAMRVGQGMALERSWADLSPAVRKAVSRTMARLSRIGLSDDPTRAGKALTALGFLRYELQHDVPGSLASLEAALRRDPNRLDAREMILHVYGVEGQWWELADTSRVYARQLGRVRFHLVAAYALTRLERFEEAKGELDSALLRQPDDLALLLSRAALALRQPEGDGVELAGSLLGRAEKEYPLQPRFKADFAYMRGLHLALTGQTAAARVELSQALVSPYNRQAKKALAILGRS